MIQFFLRVMYIKKIVYKIFMNCIELCMNIYNNIIIQKVVKNES